MQLGTRWASGAEPPRSVPDALRGAIAAVDAEAPAGAMWTLTWLEGRPCAEIDSGYEVLLTADDEVITRPWS